MSLPNPYTPGQTPRFLAGRERELTRIKDRLGRVATFGEFGGPLLTFLGPRGVGKTSLLRAAQHEALGVGFISVWVSAAKSTSLLDELAAQTRRTLGNIDSISDAAKSSWETTSRRLTAEVGAHLGPLRAGYSRQANQVREPTAYAPIASLQELLTTTARLVTSGDHPTLRSPGIVLFLDELHASPIPDLAILLNALQNMADDVEAVPLAVCGAGLPSVPASLTRAATFGERTLFANLSILEPADAAAALTEPARALGVEWSPSAIELTLKASRGYPYMLQLVGSAAWDSARPDSETVIEVEDLHAGAGLVTDQLSAVYDARWRSATDNEQELMMAMANHPDGDGSVLRSDIASALGKSSRALSVPRTRLIEKGIIDSPNHGYLTFTFPGFAQYLRVRNSEAADAPWIFLEELK